MNNLIRILFGIAVLAALLFLWQLTPNVPQWMNDRISMLANVTGLASAIIALVLWMVGNQDTSSSSRITKTKIVGNKNKVRSESGGQIDETDIEGNSNTVEAQ